jgi:4-hydroxythreonine-4-phosphate dehydrogenase
MSAPAIVEKGAAKQAAADRSMSPLVLTMGDPAGIGPDITAQAWACRGEESLPPFAVIGDAELIASRAKALGLDVPTVRAKTPKEAYRSFGDALGVLHSDLPVGVKAGQPNPSAAPAVISAIEDAVALVQSGQARAIVTNPINKKQLYDAGLPFPGHTEFLGALARSTGETAAPIMMLVSDELRVVPATIHVPLKDVPSALSRASIGRIIAGTAQALESCFGISEPRIAVAGLNPHAGENGAMGSEEVEQIAPAIADAKANGIDVTGPHPADTLFSAQSRKTYDAAVAMYHDQALIPIKTLAFERAVNLTVGLPFVRTSPDHGTAYAIAGSGQASAVSLIEAIKLADRISVRQMASQA